MSGKAKRRFLWTGVVLALLGLLPGTSQPAYGGLAALDSFHIGRYHLANGDQTKALDAFNDALRLNPQFVQAYVARGKLYAEMGQYESALVDLNFALRLQPTHAEAFAYRGFANLSLGKFQEAMPDLDMALRIDPSYARVHFLRGQALKMTGDEQGSTQSIALAKRLDPTLEVSQVVTASANGSMNDHAMQLGGTGSPQRTPITTDLLPAEQPRQLTAADRRMQGRLVPFEKHPILADVRPPSSSRLPDGTDLPPGFSMSDREFGGRGGMNSGILRNRRTTTTVIEDHAVPSKGSSGGKIPELTSPPSNHSAAGAVNMSKGAAPAKGTVSPNLLGPANGQSATAEASQEAANEVNLTEMLPIPTTAELLTVVPSEELPPTVSATPSDKSSGLLGDMGLSPVVVASTTEPTAAPAPALAADVAPTDRVVITEFEPATQLSASEIMRRRQAQGFVVPSKSLESDNERRLASAVDAARNSLAPSTSTIVGDDAATVTADPKNRPVVSTPILIAPEAALIAEAEYHRGLKLENEGNLEGAIIAYRQAIEVNPTDPLVFCRRGHLLVECERNAEALADFNETIKLAPGLSNGYFGRAHVRYITQQFADACDDYNIAIRLDDQHAQALIERGHCLAMLGRLPEAKTDREAALALDPSLAKTGPKYAMGNAAPIAAIKPVMNGATAFAGDDSAEPATIAVPKLQDATDAKLEAIPTTSDSPTAATPATIAAPAVPRVGSAFDDMFVESRPATADAPAATTTNIAKLSAADAAIAADDQATVIVSDDAKFEAAPVLPATTTEPIITVPSLPPAIPAVMPPVADMTDAAMASDEEAAPATTPAAAAAPAAAPRDRASLERDLKRLNDELVANPGDAARYYERAKTLRELGDVAAAMDDVGVALRLNPTHPESLRLRATLQIQNGKFDESLVDLNEALRLNAADAEALTERGYIRLATGQTNEAVADFTEALQAKPDDVATLCRRGMAFALLRDRDRSLADFNAALQIAPQDAEALMCRAKAHAEFGNKREAVADLTAAIKLNPRSAEAYYERSRLYAERGAYENAQADRRRAIALDPTVVR